MDKKSFLLLLLFALIIYGCVLAAQNQSRETNDKIMHLDVWMTKSEVLQILGKPYKREVYGENEFLIYETNYFAKHEKEKYTPIFFKNGKIVGWGRNYYDDAIKSKIEADININSK